MFARAAAGTAEVAVLVFKVGMVQIMLPEKAMPGAWLRKS